MDGSVTVMLKFVTETVLCHLSLQSSQQTLSRFLLDTHKSPLVLNFRTFSSFS